MACASLSDVLPLEKDEFRLAKLYAKDGDVLHVEIFRAHLSSPPPYEALSYVWGRRDQPQFILRSIHTGSSTGELVKRNPSSLATVSEQKNTTQISVTINLFHALQRLQSSDSMRVLWVDAICIDQDNLEERSMQVRVMHQIFSKATSVQAWLGPATEIRATLLSKLSSVMPFNAAGRIRETITLQEDISRPLSLFLPAISLAKSEGLSSVVDLLTELFGREWFQRVWIIQEAAANRHLRIMYGSCTLDWSVLLSLGWFAYCSYHDLNMYRRNVFFSEAIMLIERQRAPFNEPPQISPYLPQSSIFAIGSELRATDPRDHVYAMLNLKNESLDRLKPLPDYTLSLSETCWEVAKSLNLLDGAAMLRYNNPGMAAVLRLPSWTPIFLEPRSHRIFRYQKLWVSYSSSRISEAQTENGKTNALMIRGDIVSSIKWLSKGLSKVSPPSLESAAWDFSSDLVERLKILVDDTSEQRVLDQLQSLLNFIVPAPEYETFRAQIWSVDAWVRSINSSVDYRPQENEIDIPIASLDFLAKAHIALTSDDILCLVPIAAQIGDKLVTMTGCGFHCVIRAHSDFDLLIGEAYIAGPHAGISDTLRRSVSDELRGCLNCDGGYGPARTKAVYAPQLEGQVTNLMHDLGWQVIESEDQGFVITSQYVHLATLRQLGQRVDAAFLKSYAYNPLLNPEPLPRGWTNSRVENSGEGISDWIHESGIRSGTDPRMSCISAGPMISGWRVLSRWEKAEDDRLRRADYFLNVQTGELTTEDPCMGPRESLVGFKGFRLV